MNGDLATCNICQETIRSPEVDENLLLLHHIAKRGSSLSPADNEPNGLCISCQSESILVSFCPKCQGMICNECRVWHSKMKPLKNHNLLGVNGNQAKAWSLLSESRKIPSHYFRSNSPLEQNNSHPVGAGDDGGRKDEEKAEESPDDREMRHKIDKELEDREVRIASAVDNLKLKDKLLVETENRVMKEMREVKKQEFRRLKTAFETFFMWQESRVADMFRTAKSQKNSINVTIDKYKSQLEYHKEYYNQIIKCSYHLPPILHSSQPKSPSDDQLDKCVDTVSELKIPQVIPSQLISQKDLFKSLSKVYEVSFSKKPNLNSSSSPKMEQSVPSSPLLFATPSCPPLSQAMQTITPVISSTSDTTEYSETEIEDNSIESDNQRMSVDSNNRSNCENGPSDRINKMNGDDSSATTSSTIGVGQQHKLSLTPGLYMSTSGVGGKRSTMSKSPRRRKKLQMNGIMPNKKLRVPEVTAENEYECMSCRMEDPPLRLMEESGNTQEVKWTSCEMCYGWYHDLCVPDLLSLPPKKSFRFICKKCRGV